MCRFGAVAALMVGAGSPASAESTAVPQPIQEVFLGELAFAQEARELQVSLAMSLVGNRGVADGELPLTFEFGLTDRLQVALEAAGVLTHAGAPAETLAGFANVNLGTLYNLVREPDLGLLVSFGLDASLPTGTRAAGPRTFGVAPLVSVYKSFGSVGSNVSLAAGFAWPADSAGARETQLGLEAALSLFASLGAIVPIVEVGVELEDETFVQFAAGSGFLLGHGFELGACLLSQIGGETPLWGGQLALTIETDIFQEDGLPDAD